MISAGGGWPHISLMGGSLFLRMAVELNRALPAKKGIPLLKLRYHGVSAVVAELARASR
jgi:hypothetical protein